MEMENDYEMMEVRRNVYNRNQCNTMKKICTESTRTQLQTDLHFNRVCNYRKWLVTAVVCTSSANHTTPHHTTPHHTSPHHTTTPHHITPYHTTPHQTTLHHTTPHHTTTPHQHQLDESIAVGDMVHLVGWVLPWVNLHTLPSLHDGARVWCDGNSGVVEIASMVMW